MKEILFQFGLTGDYWLNARPFGNGLINSTWMVESKSGSGPKYILQRMNTEVFKQPEDILYNIRFIGSYLEKNFPDYLFTIPCKSIWGDDFVTWGGECYYRMFPFIENSHTVDVVEKPQQAYEAAKQFGKFTKLLSAVDAYKLKITLPDFHNLTLRYQQFENALETGNKERIEQSKDLIEVVKQNRTIVDQYEHCKKDLKIRCTHHDTKISNVLFDQAGKGLCVIDLDTVMPGYFISDVGDMIRTYLCPVSEEEKDYSKIMVRKEFYEAIVNGYLSEMGGELSEKEQQYFHYAGFFMIYMQAIRFLTDHLNDDAYYDAKYEGHNFVRAGNQIILLQQLQLL
ncbi:MAG: aminoglycoside phosphotransferase family protein [Ferruginibacter sp.]